MKTLEEIQRALAQHKPELHSRFFVRQIAIFGSYARSEQATTSDIDILVELERPVGWEIVDLQRFLEQLLGLKVDIVTKGALERKPLLWQSVCEELVYV